jgi:acyl-CoA thioester hydrolase
VEQAAKAPPGFRWNVRVYFEDTDAAGIVYYANYLKYFERCRTEWLRSFGIDQRELAQRERLQFVVAELAVQYHRPARLDDALLIEASVEEKARTYLVFRQRALRDDEVLASARVKVACVDVERLAPLRLPERLAGRLSAAAASPSV